MLKLHVGKKNIFLCRIIYTSLARTFIDCQGYVYPLEFTHMHSYVC